jgi:hypothetical protein
MHKLSDLESRIEMWCKMCASEMRSDKRETHGDPLKRPRLLSAAIASVIVLLSTVALVGQSRSLARHNPPIRVLLSYLAVPGFTVGAFVDMVKSSNIHGSDSALPVCVSIPINWTLYYLLFLGTLRLWGRWRRRQDGRGGS